MKILLVAINAKYIHSNLAVYSLKAYAEQYVLSAEALPCPVEIDIAMVNKYYDLASMQPEAPDSVRAHYNALSRHADECIGCKSCESRCPFSVPVAERMKKAAKLFGGGR